MRYILKVMAVAIAIFSLLGWWSVASYDGVHYKGTSEITSGQYVQIMDRVSIRGDDNFIVLGDKGEVSFTYDFYVFDATTRYDYLKKTDGGVWDTPLFYRTGQAFQDMLSGISGITLLVLMVAFGGFYFLVKRKPRSVYRFFRRIRHDYQRWQYRRLEEAGGDVLADAGLLDIGDGKGIICVRTWRIDKHFNLQSMVMDTVWGGRELEAGGRPKHDGYDGINAYRLGAQIEYRDKVMGVVELDGHYNYHSDGVVRAEHCRIIGLFMSSGHSRLGNHLSHKYGVPVFFDESPVEGYYKWLYSDNGLRAMKRNNEILREAYDVNGD